MSPDEAPRPAPSEPGASLAARIHRSTVVVLFVVMALELVLVTLEGQLLTAFLVLVIMGVTLAPVLLRDRLPVNIPPEFQVLAILFVFASLFLGEVRSFYERFWWWDTALHASSGLLLGLLIRGHDWHFHSLPERVRDGLLAAAVYHHPEFPDGHEWVGLEDGFVT